MNRRIAIVGLDIFVLLSLPILLSGQPARDLRPASVRVQPAVLKVMDGSAAYSEQIDRDYAGWVADQLRALRTSDRQARERASALERTAKERGEIIESVRRDRDRLIKDLRLARERGAAIVKDKARTEDALRRAEADRTLIETRAVALARDLREQEAEVAGLRTAQRQLETRSIRMVRSLRKRESEIAEMEAARQRLEAVKAKLEETRKQLEGRLGESARDLRERARQVARLQSEKAAIEERSDKLSQNLKQKESDLGRLESQADRLRKDLEKRRLAETGGHIEGLVQAARARVGTVIAEVGEIDRTNDVTEPLRAKTVRSRGIVVPVRFGKRVLLVAHVSALGLTHAVFDDRARSEPRLLSHFSAAVIGKDARRHWVNCIRFFRNEHQLAALETEAGAGLAAGAFRPAPTRFLLRDTVIVVASDGTFYESRFAVRENYLKLTAVRDMRYRAKWIGTSRQSPARAGDLVLDHLGNVAAILVSPTVGCILSDGQRTDTSLPLSARLRTKTFDPALPEKQTLISTARSLNGQLRVQQGRGDPFRR